MISNDYYEKLLYQLRRPQNFENMSLNYLETEDLKLEKGFTLAAILAVVLAGVGCASLSDQMPKKSVGDQSEVGVKKSYLSDEAPPTGKVAKSSSSDSSVKSALDINGPDTVMLDTLGFQLDSRGSIPLLGSKFSTQDQLSVTAEKMPVKDFIHYVYGDLFQVNYVIDQSVESSAESDVDRVTMSLANPVSSRMLYNLTNDMFLERGIRVKYTNETFFIYRPKDLNADSEVAIGIGRDPESVPNTAQEILQVVPVRFGLNGGLERTLRDLVKAKITPDFAQSTVFIQGKRAQIIKALELMDMLDTPATRGRYIALIKLRYSTPETLAITVRGLLKNEGIDASIGNPAQRNVVMVPLKRLDSLVVFASSQFLLERVNYWVGLTDTQTSGAEQKYFLYNPMYARADDLGKNIGKLFGLSLGQPQSGTGGSSQSTGNAPPDKRTIGVNTPELKMVVDERSNAIIFYTTSSIYRDISKLLRQLDTPPKQVLLDITIAEVTLKDEFKLGVEWALSQSEVILSTDGSWSAGQIGGIGLLVDGNKGPLSARAIANNTLVKVLSNPSLMVLDGVAATISVGSQISVVGSSSSDPDGQRVTQSSEYRSTGLTLSVTPTVNSYGSVTMEIVQSISNTLPGAGGAGGNPDIFSRSLNTEVVSRSGQTVMMAGLISESATKGGQGAPFLSKIPVLGHLFKASSNSKDRTELIMLITPKVLSTSEDVDIVLKAFREGFENMSLDF